MKKTLTALFAAATIAVSLAASATDVSAQHRHRHHHHHGHGGAAVGIAAGLIGGLIVGSAIANAQPAPVYVAPAATCIVDQQVWSNRYQAWVVRPVRVPC